MPGLWLVLCSPYRASFQRVRAAGGETEILYIDGLCYTNSIVGDE